MRQWTVYEHGGGRTVSSDQVDRWKEPLQVVSVDDLFTFLDEKGQGFIKGLLAPELIPDCPCGDGVDCFRDAAAKSRKEKP